MGTRAEMNQNSINKGQKPVRLSIWNRNKPIYAKETQIKPKVNAKVDKKYKFKEGRFSKATIYLLVILAKIAILAILYWVCLGCLS